jgi:energy-converting hydrogenase Eha subunit A
MQRITNLLLDILTFVIIVMIAICDTVIAAYDFVFGDPDYSDDMPERKEYKAKSIFDEDIN